MTTIYRRVLLSICAVSFLINGIVLLSGTLRAALVAVVERRIALSWPPKYALVGDSLTQNCNWRWELGPFSTIDLAIGGTDIRSIAHQVTQALALKAGIISIEGGINDVILDSAPVESISYDFGVLLRELPLRQKAVVTLIPYVANGSLTDRIDAANATIRSLAEARMLPVIDLNPELAVAGSRKREMTTDGIHFTANACKIWADKIRVLQ